MKINSFFRVFYNRNKANRCIGPVLLSFFIFMFFSFSCLSQVLPDTFKVDNYIEFLEENEVLFYFNCRGRNVSNENAEFIRWGKLDSTEINVSGNFIDFYSDGTISLKAIMKSGLLEGPAFYYYPNGQVMMQGCYKNGVKTGIWNYFYDTGIKEKTLNFVNGYPYIVDFWNRGGFQKIINGNGYYEGYFYAPNGCWKFDVKGKTINGKMDGKWSYDLGKEIFINGVFQKGTSQTVPYSDYQRIFIETANPHENVTLDENFPDFGDKLTIDYAMYKGRIFEECLYPEFLDSLYLQLDSVLNDQWFIVSFDLDKTDQLSHINIRSSINDTISESRILKVIKSMNSFSAFKTGMEKIDFCFYFMVYIKNNYIIIPRLFYLNEYKRKNPN